MSYNDQYRERDRSGSHDDDRYPHPNYNYNSSRYPSSDQRRSNWPSSSYDRRSEIPCRFGFECRNAICPYRHDYPPDPQNDRRAAIPCRFGINCTKPLCPHKHESEADRASVQLPNERTSSSSIGTRFEPPPPLVSGSIMREQPPQQSFHSHSQQRQDFSQRFEPPSHAAELKLRSRDCAFDGERQKESLSAMPTYNSMRISDDNDEESEMQKRLVPTFDAAESEAANYDSLAKQQQEIAESIDTNNNIKAENEQCDTNSIPKTTKEVELQSSAGVEYKHATSVEQNVSKNDTEISKVQSKPTDHQRSLQRGSINGNTYHDRHDAFSKPKHKQNQVSPFQPVAEPVRAVTKSTSTLANLLSSQRRSAAQLQRYRIQQARPFENMHNDVPFTSTAAPTSMPKQEMLSGSHVIKSTKQNKVLDPAKNLTKEMHKNNKADTTNGTQPTHHITTVETKASTIDKKKRKADEVETTFEACTATATDVKPRKKSKGLNGFRVKVGSVVSVRFRNLSEGGNPEVVQLAKNEQSSKAEGTKVEKRKLFEVWSEPIAGRHDGLSLLGSRIKCVFTKSFVEKWLEKNTKFAADSVRNSIEGNVVSIIGSDDDQHDAEGTIIGLLVDREKIKSLPFLQVITDDVLSSSKQALKKVEDRIKGESNVVVKIVLASIIAQRQGVKLSRGVVKQWLVRTRVSAKPSGNKPTMSQRKASSLKKHSLFVGDRNDNLWQQEKNWRWIATRTVSVNSTNESNSIDVPSQLVGEVTDMTVHDNSGSGGSLATVTIRRMWTPEQTKTGRMDGYDHLELFDDREGEVYFQAPVEDLVVIGKSVCRPQESGQLANNKNEEQNFHVTHSYDARDDTYKPLLGDVCDCSLCNKNNAELTKRALANPALDNNDNPHTAEECISSLVTSMKESANPTHFTLPDKVGLVAMRPSYVPITSLKSDLYCDANSIDEDEKSQPSHKKAKRKRRKRVKSIHENLEEDEEDSDKFKPTCSRTIPFDDITSDYWYLRNKKTTSIVARRDPSTREIARPRSVESKTKEEVTSLLTGRAARANQRRMVKGLGAASTVVDRLAGRDREKYLRFGKSSIEGWGVFTEEPLNAGDLIIEYRGELIGHAVADKREREYEEANIPDYMFRIDAFTVCDATRLGNVARFINASCSPNCYTQIITANENKRIVIYAKRDISRGEELCYDYKFPIEMDPSKRIPCGCGSFACRGYMNWDKRWD